MTEQNEIVAENPESTVVARWEEPGDVSEDGQVVRALRARQHQSEAALEAALIEALVAQGYERVAITSEADLVANLRREIERLNDVAFTDAEWARFFADEIAAKNSGVEDKTFTIQRDARKAFVFDDGRKRNITLLDRADIHHNHLQVLNQYEAPDGTHPCRYDVTVLVNGLPLVHIELKRRGVSLREAFNQINRYGRESFWSGAALFDYVQIFVISNVTVTKYYSNTTRRMHLDAGRARRGRAGSSCAPRTVTSQAFEFTSYWTDAENRLILDLADFTATFLSRHTILSVLCRYCVFDEQKRLLVMRPYQIAATEAVLLKIRTAHYAGKEGTVAAGGFVWHTTGSGKTLTSFKCAQLAARFAWVDKVLFVVDRKDLDYQTMVEYDRFEKGCANGNASCAILRRQLEDAQARVIVTTIQKLALLVNKERGLGVYQKNVVMIFDECHRSQFGDMHRDIVRRFKSYYLFGFTGTPIFKENISHAGGISRTTEDVFGARLHVYNIVDAIRDENVLRFRVDYVSTVKAKAEVESADVWDIDREKVLSDPQRVENVTRYILANFERQTKGKFNSIFAVQSIPLLRQYYTELKRQLAATTGRKLKVAAIFSFAPNEDITGAGLAEEDNDGTDGLDASSRDFLDAAIADYNAMFNTAYDTSAGKFGNYYKDVSMRVKRREVDILLVVDMFLTGFDAVTLNTLWLDKNLRYHGLLQAFSRTNRVYNSVKSFGNIVCFRNLEEATNRTLSLFGDKTSHAVSVIRKFADYLDGYTDENGRRVKGYRELVAELLAKGPPGTMPVGETEKKSFIRTMNALLRLRNLLENFDAFAAADPLGARAWQDLKSVYLTVKEELQKTAAGDAADVNDDVEFEMELIKQQEYGIDYILFLVGKWHGTHGEDTEIRARINGAIESSPGLRDKRDLIERFIAQLTPTSVVDADWRAYVNRTKDAELAALVREERLDVDAAAEFMNRAFERGFVQEGGTAIDRVLPPINPFLPGADRAGTIARVLARFRQLFSRFYGIADGPFAAEGALAAVEEDYALAASGETNESILVG